MATPPRPVCLGSDCHFTEQFSADRSLLCRSLLTPPPPKALSLPLSTTFSGGSGAGSPRICAAWSGGGHESCLELGVGEWEWKSAPGSSLRSRGGGGGIRKRKTQSLRLQCKRALRKSHASLSIFKMLIEMPGGGKVNSLSIFCTSF